MISAKFINNVVDEFKKHGLEVEQIGSIFLELHITINGCKFGVHAGTASPEEIVRESLKYLKLLEKHGRK